mgnify:CR=1 FL=1
MNTENSKFAEHDARVHATALRAFRSRRRHRKLATAALLIALVTAILSLQLNSKQQPVRPLARTVPSSPTLEKHPAATLTDEELLAHFPPGACFLAEVNGKKILVFNDPALKKQFFN